MEWLDLESLRREQSLERVTAESVDARIASLELSQERFENQMRRLPPKLAMSGSVAFAKASYATDSSNTSARVVISKVDGEFVWHKHDDTDDFFLVLSGRLTIQLRDRDVELEAGELFVVPRGVEHCPRADEPAEVLLIEPLGTTNTGDAGGDLTAEERRI